MDGEHSRCAVCGAPWDDALEPPTFSFEEIPDRPGVVRPVLNKPIRVDPESGAVCWCPATVEGCCSCGSPPSSRRERRQARQQKEVLDIRGKIANDQSQAWV